MCREYIKIFNLNYIELRTNLAANFSILNVRFWPKAVVQWVLLNVRFRWKADVQMKVILVS